MLKIFYKILLFILTFLALWLVLLQVNWMQLLHVKDVSAKIEEKFGDLMWEQIERDTKVITDSLVLEPLDSILHTLCTTNEIDYSSIKFHVVAVHQVNAFALPNNHLVVFTGLLQEAGSREAVAGVLGHELAHLQLHHVMKKLVKEVGLSVIVSATTGGNGAGAVVLQSIKLLSSSAYDRSLEQDADIQSVDYLANTGINPEPFAGFLFNMGESDGSIEKYSVWLSTHPNSKQRATYLLDYIKEKKIPMPKANVADDHWQQMLAKLDSIE